MESTNAAADNARRILDLPNLKEIIVICKTHFDIGYTHSVKEIASYYRTSMIERAMDIMDEGKEFPPERQFAWTSPGWVMYKVLEEGDDQSPALRKRIEEYMKSGRFKLHALPFTLESDTCEPEEMARGFHFASQLCRKYGMTLPVSGKMTDVPSHGGALATVLANGGIKFMHIGCNWPSAYVTTPGLFWWEGPDGSRVLTFYSSIYGTAAGFNWPKHWGEGEPNVGNGFLPPREWPYKIWPAILVTGDNSGPPTAEEFNKLFEEAQQMLPDVKIRMGTMDDFVNTFLADEPPLPVVKGEMPDTWIHGVMCDPRGMQAARKVRPQIASAEALHTHLGIWKVPQSPIAGNVATAYENILLYGEHTWGLAPAVNEYGEAFKSADPKLVARLEASWQDKSDYIYTSCKIADSITDDALKVLADNVKASKGDLIVYNPLPWMRSGMVIVNENLDGFLIDNDTGKKITVSYMDERVAFFAEDVPACGYKTYMCTKAQSQDFCRAAPSLENSFFKLILDAENGCIASLIDKRTGREWVDPAAEYKLGQYLNERFTFEQTLNYTMAYQMGRAKDWPHHGMHKGNMVSEKETPYRAATNTNSIVKVHSNYATIESPADSTNHVPAILLKITLNPYQPFIDLQLTIQDKAKDNWPEADWLCLPFKVQSPQFRIYRQLGVMNPVTDILPGANRDLFSVGHGLTITDADGAGIAVCPLDHPLVSLDRPGCWKFSKNAEEFTPKKPIIYVNLYNNQWNTNFRYWYPGTWSSRVRLWTFDSNTPIEDVMATPTLESRNPFLSVFSSGTGKALPSKQSGVCVSRKGVTLTAFGQNPDGDGTLLRIWEQSGVSAPITINLPESAEFNTATPVNLRGEVMGEPINIMDHQWMLHLHAYAPASFILK